MNPIEGQPILTAAQMRAAEQRAIDAGATVSSLMERAGTEVAHAVHRLAVGADTLIVCGPGNNGGDGFVAARVLAANGASVRVAALGVPKSEAAMQARAAWPGHVEAFPAELPARCRPAPIVVDALFGTGLARPVEGGINKTLAALILEARLSIAVDLPSGTAADSGAPVSRCRGAPCDVTLALGALKPAHVLQPGADRCGSIRLLDIGLELDAVASLRGQLSTVATIDRPRLDAPEPWSHKYNRGTVAVVAGRMHGAAELAANAAYRAGAGYVLLLTGGLPQPPHAIVRRSWSADALDDKRIGAVVIGPGLGRDDRAREKLAAATASDRPLVIDGDALHLLDLDTLAGRTAATVLTPHEGEFAALFGHGGGSKIDRTRAAATRSGATVVHKGADTVIAHSGGHEDGFVYVATDPQPLLATAGTGDVLAGTIAAMLVQPFTTPLRAAAAGVWLHKEAARLLGRPLIADDLLTTLPDAIASAGVR